MGACGGGGLRGEEDIDGEGRGLKKRGFGGEEGGGGGG